MKFKCQACGKNRPCTIEIVGEGVPPKFCPYGNDQEQPAEWVVDVTSDQDVKECSSLKNKLERIAIVAKKLHDTYMTNSDADISMARRMSDIYATAVEALVDVCTTNVPQTNRDIINAMSDEELADTFFAVVAKRDEKNGMCRIYWQNPLPCRPWLNCRMCLREWLKAPAGKHQKIAENTANN